MTQVTPALAASSPPTLTYERFVGQAGVVAVAATATTDIQPCAVFRIEDRAGGGGEVPQRHKSVADLVSRWSTDDARRVALEEARAWVADTFLGDDGETVRSLRLGKGWSQAQLASEMGTSQPHIARIERGTENVAIETCRRLAKALGVDMNSIDSALRRQEILAAGKTK